MLLNIDFVHICVFSKPLKEFGRLLFSSRQDSCLLLLSTQFMSCKLMLQLIRGM